MYINAHLPGSLQDEGCRGWSYWSLQCNHSCLMQETALYYTVGASNIRYCLWMGIFMLQYASSKKFCLVSFPLSNAWSESLHSQCFLISIVFVPERHLNIYDTRRIRLSVLRANSLWRRSMSGKRCVFEPGSFWRPYGILAVFEQYLSGRRAEL